MNKLPLPIHSLTQFDMPVQVRPIEHENPYDFTREHRHTYFEIFFFERGGGIQLIDFNEFPVADFSCYIVFPRQIHLLKRAKEAFGTLVQFSEEALSYPQVRLLLQQHSFSEKPAVLFESDETKCSALKQLLSLLSEATNNTSQHSGIIALNLLQVLLLRLMEGRELTNAGTSTDRNLLFRFQQLLEEQFMHNHVVSKYAAALHTTEKKLSATTRQYLGLSPLQVIHNRILLEAKRLLLFEDHSHKEISFMLGFDSPASFSLFIRNKTGYNPSEINLQLVNIHK